MNPKHPLEIVPSRVAARLPELPSPVLDMLRLCDGTRTLESLQDESPFPAEQTSSIVRKLISLGVVQPSPGRGRRSLSEKALAWAHGRNLPVFSEDEEQFFASPVPEE